MMTMEDLDECVECGQLIPTAALEDMAAGCSWNAQDFQYFEFDGGYLLCGDCVVDVREIAEDVGYLMCDWCGAFGDPDELDADDNGVLACGACDAVFEDE